MTKNEFLEGLMAALNGEVSKAAVNENVRYYKDYIEQEVQRGKSEQEVLDQLGDPALIARTIIDTSGSGQSGYSDTYGQESTYSSSQGASEAQKGFHTEFNEEGGFDVKYGRFKVNSWYGKLILIVAVVAVIVLVVSLISGLISLVAPILLPVLLICFLLSLFRQGRR